MGTFGDEFINVDAIWRSSGMPVGPADSSMSDDVRFRATWMSFTSNLQTRIDSLASDNLAGGLVYFPPRNYYLTNLLRFYPNITAIFSPGAVLHPALAPEGSPVTNFHVYLDGNIQAGLHKIIDPPFRGGVFEPRRGRLVIQENRVREIYPEWWGAEPIRQTASSADVDSADALQSSFNCAFHEFDRRSSIPVVLSGMYLLGRPLFIGQRPWMSSPEFPNSEIRSFILRGQTGPEHREAVGIGPHPSFVPPSGGDLHPEEYGLLIVRGPRGFLIENITFRGSRDDRRLAYSCLRVEVQTTEMRGTVDSQVNRVKGCKFIDATTATAGWSRQITHWAKRSAGA